MKAPLSRYELLLLSAGALWGTSFVSTKIGLGGVDPLVFALLRFVLGTIVIMAVIFWLKRFDAKMLADPLIVFNAFINALGFALQNVGMTSTSVTNSVLLININVGLVAVLAAIVLAETITNKIIVGIILGMIGVLIISTNGDFSSIYSGTFIGNLLVFAAGVLWAVYIVYQKRILDRQPDVLMVTGAIILETMLFLIPLAFLFAGSFAVEGNAWLALVYVGVLCTGGANLLYNAGLKGTKASVSSVILLIEIVFAMVFAFLLLQEMPTMATAIGGGLIVLSILVISFSNGRGKKAVT